jgi:hypothetical protein
MLVINAYFALLSWQEHMTERPGGTAYIENTFMTGFMKRDGVDGADLENLYPMAQISKISRNGHWVLDYLAHDMQRILTLYCFNYHDIVSKIWHNYI